MTGFVNSIQSLGAVDGPGVRYVVFMQGCPLRCVYCHNPDTWLTEGGTPTDADELVRRALRFRPYWKNGGGVTVTGGEPLLQADFVAEFFEKLHEHGVHTALDTSGVGNLAQAEKVLEHTDLVLCDLKFLSKADYLKNCRADYGQIERFLQLTAMKGVPLWIRHVVVPGLTVGVSTPVRPTATSMLRSVVSLTSGGYLKAIAQRGNLLVEPIRSRCAKLFTFITAPSISKSSFARFCPICSISAMACSISCTT